ncbi:MAG: hypothetical protein HC933_18610 [Pleurocapsa sp. SU_196_0]|nr:hypothetical protein [Pleurocapsa sp. SU_196_0]
MQIRFIPTPAAISLPTNAEQPKPEKLEEIKTLLLERGVAYIGGVYHRDPDRFVAAITYPDASARELRRIEVVTASSEAAAAMECLLRYEQELMARPKPHEIPPETTLEEPAPLETTAKRKGNRPQ